jgi:DNA primase
MTATKNSRFIGFTRLKAAISMRQVLERYGLLERLRPSGDSLSGTCPLHDGHNPTQFRVSLSKNCYICFGDCHSGGSIVDFVSRKEGIGIREAGLLLQDWFGLNPDDDPDPASGKQSPRIPQMTNVIPFTKTSNPPLRFTLGPLDEAHPYLKERGLTPETISEFGVGCCPHGTLRGWIALPIQDVQGHIVAYAGRYPGDPPDGLPKYRLPRGFRKSLELFNQHRAATETTSEPLVVVEGFFGCMRVWQAGHRRVVSLMGSMLSRGQEDRIADLTGDDGHVLLLFDEDAAGRKGRAEARERLSRRVSVSVVRLAEGRQPDSLDADELLRLIGTPAPEQEAA